MDTDSDGLVGNTELTLQPPADGLAPITSDPAEALIRFVPRAPAPWDVSYIRPGAAQLPDDLEPTTLPAQVGGTYIWAMNKTTWVKNELVCRVLFEAISDAYYDDSKSSGAAATKQAVDSSPTLAGSCGDEAVSVDPMMGPSQFSISGCGTAALPSDKWFTDLKMTKCDMC